jgi:single-strand DNA-binding protein
MNKVILTGYLVKEIELKKTKSGISVVSNCIAVKREIKNKDGQYLTDFINFTVWNKPAEHFARYARKGDRLEIVGRWENRDYQSGNQKRVISEVIVESISAYSKGEREEQPQEVIGGDIIEELPDGEMPF